MKRELGEGNLANPLSVPVVGVVGCCGMSLQFQLDHERVGYGNGFDEGCE